MTVTTSSSTTNHHQNPIWVATKLFAIPALTHVAGLRFMPSKFTADHQDQFWTALRFYFGWQLVWAAVYFPLLYAQHKRSSFLVSVMLRSWPLGLGASFGAHLVLQSLNLPFASYLAPLGLFLLAYCLCHYTEFVAIGLRNPASLTLDNFLLSFSDVHQDRPRFLNPVLPVGYEVPGTIVAALAEYVFELWYFGPETKLDLLPWLPYAGFGLCLSGELIRKSAMLTAGRSFKHFVQNRKADDHRLVTGGIYSRFRHPSYVGYFAWLVGTQIILVNPISLPLMSICSWITLRNRIEREEKNLVEFFGPDYLEYQRRVSSGIPFIK